MCNRLARRPFYAQAMMDGLVLGCWEDFMFNLVVIRLKRVLILGAFLLAAIWLVWRGEAYDDRHNSALPAIMCAIESLVLVITGAAIAARKLESNPEESWQSE